MGLVMPILLLANIRMNYSRIAYTMKIAIEELQTLGRKAVKTFGYNDGETQAILDVLMYAQMRGNNQGLVKLIGKGIPKDPRASEMQVVRETACSTLLDGAYNMAIIAVQKAVELALEKTREHGFGIVGTNNTYDSSGAIGYYASDIANTGNIGLVFAGSPPTVCTHGSHEPVFGTNPLAIGVPSEGKPVVLDMATAAMAYYGVIEAKTAGLDLPADVAYSSEGKLTTSPEEALKGAIRPFDRSHKGAGLALMVEILTGPLVGACFAGTENTGQGDGNLVIVIDPALLMDEDIFRSQVSQLIRKVKDMKKLPDVGEILVPGERGDRVAQARLESGETNIDENLYQELKKVAER